MGRLSVDLCGIELENPVIQASGTCGYGHELSEIYDINILGSFSFKGTTLLPREGNILPRIAEAPSGMINAVGLENPGIEKVLAEEIPRIRECFGKPVMANISGFSVSDYALLAERLDEVPEIGWIEVNISCPNAHGGGMSFGTDPAVAAEVTKAVKGATGKKVIVKLTPNVTDITVIAKACEDAGADALALINTVKAMRINLRTMKPILGNTSGGLSGPAIFPIALCMVYETAQSVSVPIVGIGGISSAEDVIEMMMAGASAVEIGAAGLRDPYALKNIIEELPCVLDRYGIGDIREIIGRAL